MKGLFAFIIIIATSFTSILHAQMEIEGVKLLETQKIGEHTLSLNGAGVREKLWFDIYVCSLYLPEKNNDAEAVVSADKPMSLKLNVISSMLTSDKMQDATLEGFKKSTHDNMAPIKKEIDQLITLFKDEITVGDVYELNYLPEEGVQVLKNGSLKDVIKGLPFKQALFGIWLSDNPVQKDLKAELLGN